MNKVVLYINKTPGVLVFGEWQRAVYNYEIPVSLWVKFAGPAIAFSYKDSYQVLNLTLEEFNNHYKKGCRKIW